MAVYNVGMRWVQAKFPQDFLARFALFDQIVIGVARLGVRLRLQNKIPFKCGHFAFAKQRGFGSAPKIPEEVARIALLFRPGRCEICAAHLRVDIVQVLLAGKGFIPDGYRIKFPIFRHQNAAVIQQIGVHTFVHAAMRIEEPDMLAQFLAV